MSINLLPWREKKLKQHQKYFCYRIILSLLLTITICFSLNFIWHWRINQIKHRLSSDNSIYKINRLKHMFHLASHQLKQARLLHTQTQHAQKKLAQSINMLTIISNKLPDNTELLSLELKKNIFLLSGKSLQCSAAHDYYRLLETSPFHIKAILSSIEKQNQFCHFTIKVFHHATETNIL